MEEALVLSESLMMETNSYAKLLPKLYLESQAPEHGNGLRSMDCFEYIAEQK